MLYSNNCFEFFTDLPLPKGSLTKLPYHSLRDMRNVRIVVDTFHINIEHEEYLMSFVNVVNAYAEDSSKKSILQRLEVSFQVDGQQHDYASPGSSPLSSDYMTLRPLEYYMCSLELLVKLPKIESVKILRIPAWLSQCLEICIQGGYSSEVPILRWSTKKVKKTKNHAAYRKSGRRAGQPILDWTEFGRMHSITIPEAALIFYEEQPALRMV